MTNTLPLARSFAAAVPAGTSITADAALELLLQRLVDRARARWPELELDEPGFVAHAARGLGGGDVLGELDELHAPDLWLAWGCTVGDRESLQSFDREVLSQVGLLIGRMTPTPQLVDEVRQQLRHKLLLVPRPGEPPRIAAYAGRGPLHAWVRVAATRAAIDYLRSAGARYGAEVEPDDLSSPAQNGGDGPEVDYLKERYRPQFKAAFQAALRELDSEQRNVLRLHVVEGLNIDEIGALFKVHRSTVARWIAAARRQVLAAARDKLADELGLSAPEFDSLAGIVRSQLDLSVANILKKTKA
jgi:RNA polymerase sigma-70 factor, ECF subfamily